MSPRDEKRRIAVISDSHLGDRRSTLENHNVVKKLIKELNQGKKIDELILLGDILDLAFSAFQDVIRKAREFFKRISSLDIGKIIYIPGNHDYHIWLLHVEKRDVIEPIGNEGLPKLPNYISQFSDKESFFSEVLPDDLEEKFVIRYPNYEFENNGIHYVFHHGHQVYGPCVLLMGPGEALREGKSLNDLLIANSPILELIYYHLERSKEMRDKLYAAWEEYGSPGALLVIMNELLDALAPKLLRWLIHPIWAIWLESRIKRMKKDRGTEIDEIEHEIRNYLQVSGWQYQKPLRFIFGHSHVPGRKEIADNLAVVNCGSWLKEDSSHNTYVLIEDNTLTLRKLGEKDPIW
jgi:UDP-2,3-diacylglucosamine pyrophosphatase LpxH